MFLYQILLTLIIIFSKVQNYCTDLHCDHCEYSLVYFSTDVCDYSTCEYNKKKVSNKKDDKDDVVLLLML